jgi:hypothetical protein
MMPLGESPPLASSQRPPVDWAGLGASDGTLDKARGSYGVSRRNKHFVQTAAHLSMLTRWRISEQRRATPWTLVPICVEGDCISVSSRGGYSIDRVVL